MLRKPSDRRRRIFLAAVRLTVPFTTVMAAGAALSACGASTVRYLPATAGPAGICYYVTTPAECANRHVVGTPTPITPQWFSTYYPFYSSSYYSSTYVPSDEQTDFQNDVSTFQSQNDDSITDDDSDGDWTDTEGNTWSGAPSDDPNATFDSSDDSGSSDDSSDDGGEDDGGDDGGGDDDDGGGDDGGGGDD